MLKNIAGWYRVYPWNIRWRTEADKHRHGAHHQTRHLVPGRADDRTRFKHCPCSNVAATQVGIMNSIIFLLVWEQSIVISTSVCLWKWLHASIPQTSPNFLCMLFGCGLAVLLEALLFVFFQFCGRHHVCPQLGSNRWHKSGHKHSDGTFKLTHESAALHWMSTIALFFTAPPPLTIASVDNIVAASCSHWAVVLLYKKNWNDTDNWVVCLWQLRLFTTLVRQATSVNCHYPIFRMKPRMKTENHILKINGDQKELQLSFCYCLLLLKFIAACV